MNKLDIAPPIIDFGAERARAVENSFARYSAEVGGALAKRAAIREDYAAKRTAEKTNEGC